jgi:FixJ family two-component response regulator
VDRAIARDARQRDERAHLALRARIDTLTSRELVVLRRVVEGRLNKQIAGISEHAVKHHLTTGTTMLQVRSVAELTRRAQAAALFDEQAPSFPRGE